MALFVSFAVATIGIYEAAHSGLGNGAMFEELFFLIGLVVLSLGSFLLPFVLAAITYVVFGSIRGDDGTYEQHLCVIVHTGILSLLGTLITVSLAIAQGGTYGGEPSIATFFPMLSGGFLFLFLSDLQVLRLWAVIVVGIGLTAIDPRRSTGSTVVILLVIQVVLSLGWSAFQVSL